MLLRLTSMKFRLPHWPWAVLLCVAVMHAAAQVAPSPDAPPQGPAGDPNQDDQQQPLETLKVNVNLVSLYFTVHDKHGALIPHLTKDDFTILEDKDAAEDQELHRRERSAPHLGNPARYQRKPAECSAFGATGRRCFSEPRSAFER